VRALIAILLLTAGCKKSENAAPPAAPHVSKFEPLPAGPAASVDPSQDVPAFPTEAPVIVAWRGGGETPRTELSLRIWADGTVRFTCGKRGALPPERVSAMLDTFDKLGWTSGAPVPPVESDPACIISSVQILRGGTSYRRNSACGATISDEADAAEFVRSVVAIDPC